MFRNINQVEDRDKTEARRVCLTRQVWEKPMYYVSQKPRDKHVLGKLEYCFLLKRNEENKSFPKIEILIIENWGPVKIVIIVMRKT